MAGTCQATYTTELLPIKPECSEACANVSFNLSSITSTVDSGGCHFTYWLKRDKVNPDGTTTTTPFNGTETVPCPGEIELIFYCEGQTCPRYKITLRCEQGH